MKSIINNQADVFDEVAQDYRSLHSDAVKISGETSEYFAEYKIIELKRHLDTCKGIKILDIGCGDGISAGYFRKHLNVIQYDGYDISEESLKVGKARNLPNTRFNHYDGYKLNAAADNFDLVFISCVLHHIDHTNHINLLQQAHEALRKGGKLVIFEHNPFNPLTRKIVRDCVFDKDAVLISPSVMKKEVKQAGFPLVECFFTLFFPRTKLFNFLLFAEKYMTAIPLGGQYYIMATK